MKKNNILKLIIAIVIVIIIILVLLLSYLIKGEEISDEIYQLPVEDIEGVQLKEKYECNEFTFTTLTSDNLVRMYLNDYKNNILNDLDKAYNSLNLEYKEKRFGSIENYKEYINENIEKISQITLKQYQINSYEEYEEYVCLDQYDNYYIFNVTAVMQYTLKLDTYTLDSEKFINTYNNSNAQEKGMLNIDKFITMINSKDYQAVYSKLDETFKNNNFSTLNDFKNYIKQNLFEYNSVSYDSWSNEGEIYIYQIIISDKTANSRETKNMEIIMKLNSDMDFIMSFNIK